MLTRMSKNVDRKTKLRIYSLFIRPRIEYANVVYGSNLTQAQCENLEHVQRKALLYCTGAYQHTSHAKLLRETGIDASSIRRK